MRRLAAAVFLLATLLPTGARAQTSHSYLVRLGRDTLSLERVTRTPTQVRGEFVVRTPRSLHRTYVMELAADSTVRRFEMVTRVLGAAVPARESRASIDFLGDSALVTTPRGDSSMTTRVPAGRGAVPSLNGVMGVMDQLAQQARTAASESVAVVMIPLGGPSLRGMVSRAGGDTLLLDVVTPVGRVPAFRLKTDAEHRLVTFSGVGSVFQAEAERIAEPDFAALAEAFATRPIGALSTRDTVRATVAGAELWLDYGRPFRRGRDVFGTVVPWDIVWRTGANAATQFRTSAELRIGAVRIPAGTYTLWTLPSPEGWKLIVNAQTGQWGTQYDPERDVVRVKLTSETIAQPVEQLTMSFEQRAQERALVIAWDRTRLSVPIRASR